MSHLLLVEDDQEYAEIIGGWLEQQNHTIDTVELAEDGLELLEFKSYDVIILDWELPGMSGTEFLRKIRDKGTTTPVIMLTGRSSVDDKETGLETGADDYLTKPFELRELQARIKALMRRPTAFINQVVKAGRLELLVESGSVTIDQKPIDLTRKEFVLLELFMRNPNRLYSNDAIMDFLWKYDEQASDAAVRIIVSRLRKKLKESGYCPVRTVYGLGYKLEDPFESSDA